MGKLIKSVDTRTAYILSDSVVETKNMGLYKLERLSCGCDIEYWAGGLRVTEGCANHGTYAEYHCPVCAMVLKSKLDLKKHRWKHAI